MDLGLGRSPGLGLQRLEAAFQFPARDRIERAESEPPDQWSVTKALALWLCRKDFPQRCKVVKEVKCAAGGGEYRTCGQTRGCTDRGSRVLMGV